LLAALTFSLSFATDKNAGTSGAVFLKMGAGARPTAMGNAFVGIADDVNAVYFNPAGLASLERPELTALQTQWIEGINYNFGAYAHPLASGVLAFSAATLQVGDIERRNESEGLDGTFDNLDSAYAVSFGRNLGQTYSLGLTGRYIKEKIDSTSASAWSSDIGIMKRFDNRPLSLGLAIRHLGPEIKFRDEGDPQPLTIDGGAGYKLFHDRLLMGLNMYKPRDNSLKFGLGFEWKGNLSSAKYALRAGYNSSNTDADGATGLTVGAGLGLGRFTLDFGWVPMGDLGNTFRYAAHMRF
jgi:hypothetical protein